MPDHQQRPKIGLIIGNRGFFPDHLCATGREDMLRVMQGAGIEPVALSTDESKFGAVETFQEAKRCAELFKKHREEIQGVIVSLPNFGDERAIADTMRLSGLNVPVLVQATPDTPNKMTIRDRRDSFCGKMSACNNLMQYGIPYSLTTLHTEAPDSEEFKQDLDWFVAVCRVVRGLRGLRVGSIGARPAAFNTVRYSEKLLEANGISVITIDLSEILGRIHNMNADDPSPQKKLADIKSYVSTEDVPESSLIKMAKLGAVIDGWMQDNELAISAVQCWTALEEYFGVVPCTVMSMMSNNLMSSACEVDIVGVVGMQALALASQTPSALLDWNNNYGDDPNKAVCFHCSNLPKHFFNDVKMEFQEIIAGTVGKLNTFGTLYGRVKAAPMSYLRVSTRDQEGKLRAYVGDGHFTNDPLETFGGAGVVEIPRLQSLLHYICEQGFEHHTAANLSHSSRIVHEAGTKYLGWEMYWHQA
ncbi:MAG TPA: L-fucose/L-arabinose isomerase family protein [Bryobacteraceae bacterium]|nr:L-fucose/L-arabinose isomerase family protein [Bryobacteraceae bacterium]